MKIHLKRLICLLICIATVFSLASCEYIERKIDDFFDWAVDLTYQNYDGYTGGFPNDPESYRFTLIQWVETFDEAKLAYEHLMSAGNNLGGPTLMTTYENELVDVKYCFDFDTQGMEKQKDKEWYDKKYSSARLYIYLFLDDVTIEEIEYSDVYIYRSAWFYASNDEKYDPSQPITIECGESNEDDEKILWRQENRICRIRFGDDPDGCYAGMMYFSTVDHREEFPENFHEEFAKSLVLVGG